MAITGEHIQKFTLIDIHDIETEFSWISKIKIKNVQSKHIASINDNTTDIHELSQKVDYKNSIIGSHRQTILEDERQRILNMMKSSCLRAARFVVSKDERIWSDNTHWSISYILRYGNSATIGDIPSYFIDFRNSIPIVINKNNVVFDSSASIKSAIACAKRIQDRIDDGWRPIDISFTIEDLMKDLDIFI